MAIVKCKECGAEVSDKAEICPQCGAPILQKTSRTLFIFMLTVIFLIVFIVLGQMANWWTV